MTPRLEWTWAGSVYMSMAIRFHCWKSCICAVPSKQMDFDDPLLAIFTSPDIYRDEVPKETGGHIP